MKITQGNLLCHFLNILDVEGEITLQEFVKRVPEAFKLSEYDLALSVS